MNPIKIMIVLVVLLLLVLAGCVVQPTPEDKKTISTSGTATLSVQPDEANVYVAIETLKETAEASKNKNSEITDQVLAALYKINIPRDSIETQYFNIYEDFEWTETGRKSLGFKTVHNLKINTDDFGNVGKIIDAVIGAGATRIDSINFELSDEKQSELKKQVLAQASRDAREKAEAIASGIGAQLGDIRSISDVSYNYVPYPLFRAEMGAAALEKAVSTEISPQKLEVSANVQVVFEIK